MYIYRRIYIYIYVYIHTYMSFDYHEERYDSLNIVQPIARGVSFNLNLICLLSTEHGKRDPERDPKETQATRSSIEI